MKTEYQPFLLSGIAFALSAVMAFVSMPRIMRYTQNKNLLDIPNERSSHRQPSPSMGGLSFLSALFVAMPFVLINAQMAVVIGLLFFIMWIGFLDDSIDLNYKIKFAAQIFAGVILFVSDIGFYNTQIFINWSEWPMIIAFVASVLFVVGTINAFNLIDGIDGLAGGLGWMNTLFFGIGFIYLEDLPFAVLAFAISGALLAFLKFNFYPARIFMGDTGSLLIGLVMAVLFFRILVADNDLLNGAAVAVLILPSLDMVRLFMTRLSKGVSPFKADKNHLHHLLIKLGDNHAKAAWTCYVINLVLILEGVFLSSIYGLTSLVLFLIATGILAFLLIDVRFYLKCDRSQKELANEIMRKTENNALLKTKNYEKYPHHFYHRG